jgi:hypothetical protein
MSKLFTKSRFKIGLECPTKLYYNDQSDYKNRMSDDTFLQFLADGGHMVGEFAKFKYHGSPNDPDITVRETGYDTPVAETNRRLAEDLASGASRTVIAEAAVRYKDFFIRIDILVADHHDKTLTLVEVKAKSVSQEDINQGFKNANQTKYKSDWLPYLYDVAFQTLVTEHAVPTILGGALAEYRVVPKLMLVHKETTVKMDRLNRFVRIHRDPTNPRSAEAVVLPGTTAADLGDLSFLREVDMTKIVNELRSTPVPGDHIPDGMNEKLWIFMNWSCEVQQTEKRIFTKPDKRCKQCQFRAKSGESMRSGIHECWANALEKKWLHGRLDNVENRDIPLSIDLYGGGAGPISTAGKVLEVGHAFLADIQEAAIAPKTETQKESFEFTPHERRVMQIDLVKKEHPSFLVQKETLNGMITSWDFPWHMIDFETSAPSVPFFSGMRPYQTVAFQFSHHRMEEDGSVVHANQYIRIEADGNPNIDFVRALRTALMPNGVLHGTVFRYSNHENTVLKKIYEEIESEAVLADRDELLDFIDLITDQGQKTMVDLQRVVLKGYISRHAGGSNSLKYVLPAILKDAPRTAALYAKSGAYGKNFPMTSLNFDNHVWLTPDSEGNPYQTLPSLFEIDGLTADEVDDMMVGLMDDKGGTIDQGGLAMAAYNLTRYSDLKDEDRQRIKDSLFRYCELDTLAMCMLAQGLRELGG